MAAYYKLRDAQLRIWADNFYTVCSANAATLGLDLAELTSIDTARDQYVAALDNVAVARAMGLGATATKNTEKASLLDTIAVFANQFQSNPGVSQELIAELGLTVRGTGGGSVPLYPASGLTAVGCSDGLNRLKWAANGNESGTTYVIEAAFDGSVNWEYVDVSTSTRFDHTGQTPGRAVVYRIVATRSGFKAPPSNEAALYTGGSSSASQAA